MFTHASVHDRSTLQRRWARSVFAAVVALCLGALTLAGPEGPASAYGRHGRDSGDVCGATTYKPNGTPWECTFQDDFNDSSLDTSKWSVTTTANSNFYVGQTCLTADNVSESNGQLHVTTKRLAQPFVCKTPTGSFTTSYTGGHVSTYTHFSQTYGKFEIRAREPYSTAGLHSAFWLSPDKLTYGAWPASGEIDVSEWWSNTPTYSVPTLHYTGSGTKDSGLGCTVADPTAWHTYAVVWEPTEMQFSIDGTTCFTDSWAPAAPLVAPQPFDQPFAMALTMAAGPALGANAVTTQTTFPASYDVDYVKAWK